MNKHIKEFSVKAGATPKKVASTVVDRDGIHATSMRTVYNNVDIIQFAKLLVEECAEVAGCNAHVSGFALGDLIKQHFEIEND